MSCVRVEGSGDCGRVQAGAERAGACALRQLTPFTRAIVWSFAAAAGHCFPLCLRSPPFPLTTHAAGHCAFSRVAESRTCSSVTAACAPWPLRPSPTLAPPCVNAVPVRLCLLHGTPVWTRSCLSRRDHASSATHTPALRTPLLCHPLTADTHTHLAGTHDRGRICGRGDGGRAVDAHRARRGRQGPRGHQRGREGPRGTGQER